MDMNQLSRYVSHALRHQPWVYELELDDEGWVDVDQLIESLRTSKEEFRSLGYADLKRMIQGSSKKRHEFQGKRIRALYGHSFSLSRSRRNVAPPTILFHGTSEVAFESISIQGLKSMGRQHVHLSVEVETAREVGRRKTMFPVIAKIEALKAYVSGVEFYRGNEKVWLANAVPSEYVSRH